MVLFQLILLLPDSIKLKCLSKNKKYYSPCSSISAIIHVFLRFGYRIIIFSLLFFPLYVVYCSPFHIILLLLLISFTYVLFQTAWKCFNLSRGSFGNRLSISTSLGWGLLTFHPPYTPPGGITLGMLLLHCYLTFWKLYS